MVYETGEYCVALFFHGIFFLTPSQLLTGVQDQGFYFSTLLYTSWDGKPVPFIKICPDSVLRPPTDLVITICGLIKTVYLQNKSRIQGDAGSSGIFFNLYLIKLALEDKQKPSNNIYNQTRSQGVTTNLKIQGTKSTNTTTKSSAAGAQGSRRHCLWGRGEALR